jgi:hypothetical protein
MVDFPFVREATFCSPACGAANDCPAPAGMYDATLACVGGRCQLDCTAVGFPFPVPKSCPGGMTCATPQLTATSQCYAN